MAHGVKPVLPFDITLTTFIILNLANPLSTVELIATQICQLQRHEDDLVVIQLNVLKSQFKSVQQFKHPICNFNFQLQALILVQNSSVKTNLGCKAKPHYIGPMVVIRCTQNGLYCLAKLNRTISNLHFAAFHLVPYHTHLCTSIPMTCLVNQSDLACIFADEDIEGVVEGFKEV